MACNAEGLPISVTFQAFKCALGQFDSASSLPGAHFYFKKKRFY
jgi:hypothetical protein